MTRITILFLPILAGTLWSSGGCQGQRKAERKATNEAKPVREEGPQIAAAIKRPPRFTISKETTYVLGPLDEDGFIDYPAALNEILSQGVTPENNAYVLLWKAIGPEPDGKSLPPKFFEMLGMETPPAKGNYFVPLHNFGSKHGIAAFHLKEEVPDYMDQITSALWKAKDHPDLADWLEANQKALLLVIEASKRSRSYCPITTPQTNNGRSGLITTTLFGVQHCRDFAAALRCRAMGRVEEGRLEEAFQDLLACHRLGRLVGSGGTLIECLVGIFMEMIAGEGYPIVLAASKAEGAQLRAWLQAIQQVPPPASVADHMDVADRYTFLDHIMMSNRDGFGYLNLDAQGNPRESIDSQTDQAYADVNWDPALRVVNSFYDRIVGALRQTTRATRQEELAKLDVDLRAKAAKYQTPGGFAKALRADRQPGAHARNAGDFLVTRLLPAFFKVQTAADRAEQTYRNLLLAFALEIYQRENGRYPKGLADLAPKYLPHVPDDLFSGKDLIYRPAQEGYLLYSVGPNGVDEGGRRGEDARTDPDDIAVRMPLPKPKTK